MKRYILSILLLSVIGGAVASLLLYQHFFPYSDFALTACGSGVDNSCAQLSRSGYSVLLGLPLAGYGLIGYLFLIITAALALTADESWHVPCFAIQLPVAVAFVIIDVALGSILIYLKLSCRLCVATYVINILIGITLFLCYISVKEDGAGLRSLYHDFFSLVREHRNRPVEAAFSFAVLFMVLSVFFLSAFLEARGSAAEPTAAELDKFEEHFYSITQEDVSLPESAMSLGPESARIRIVAFTDFLCSACMQFYETGHYLMSRFPGKIRIDYYSFPLDTVCNSHIPKTVYPNSCVAAQAFSAAARRGIFRELMDSHYGHYRENVSRMRSGDVMAGFREYFEERPDRNGFTGFLKETMSEASRSSVHETVGLGGAMNIRAVPTIFINGRRLEGVPEAKLLERVLSRELNRN